jgi:hypothetical protein
MNETHATRKPYGRIDTSRGTPLGLAVRNRVGPRSAPLTQRRYVSWSGENPNTDRNGRLFQSLSTPAASCSDFLGSIDFQSSPRCSPDPNFIGRRPSPLILNDSAPSTLSALHPASLVVALSPLPRFLSDSPCLQAGDGCRGRGECHSPARGSSPLLLDSLRQTWSLCTLSILAHGRRRRQSMHVK